MLTIGMIIGGGFRLVRERPGAVLAWGAIYALATFGFGYLMMSTTAPVEAMGNRPDPGQALAAVSGMFAKVLLLEIAFFLLYTILLTAAQRAVLRPEESALASIRFGGGELRMIGLGIFLGFLFFVFYIVSAIVIGILAAATGFAAGGTAGMIGVGVVGALIVIALLLFFWVKVSLAFPLTLMRGRFVLGEAWRLSRGHFWTLLVGYLVLGLIVLVILVGGSLAVHGGYWSQLLGGGMTGPAARQAARAQMESQYTLGLPMLLTLLFSVVIGGLTIAFTGGAVATAARALAADQSGVAETFA